MEERAADPHLLEKLQFKRRKVDNGFPFIISTKSTDHIKDDNTLVSQMSQFIHS